MKKIGIIGGLAWPSTADYYRLLCKQSNEHFRLLDQSPPYATPAMVIESLNINETRSARGTEGDERSWVGYDSLFRDAFIRLKDAGAEFGMIASNTPHMRLHSIVKGLDFPVVSILDTTASAVASHGGKNALILGTPMTMLSSVYPEVLRRHDVSALAQLSSEEIAELGQLIDVDLYQGVIENARQRIIEISEAHINNPATDFVCLACTELPLAFPEYADTALFEHAGITFVNTIAAHVSKALDTALERV